jgi:hypothetical protein
MTIKDLKTALLSALQPKLEQRGFKLQKSKERFAKRIAEVSWWFVLDFTVYESLHVKPAIGLRVDAIENKFHQTSGFERKYQADTPTLSLSLQGLVADPSRFEYVIRDLSDVDTAAAQLERDFDEIVFPYFEKYSALAMIDAALNENPGQDCVHYAMDYLRCAHGLIVAGIVGRPNYADLVGVYRQKLALISNGFYIPKFEALVADLAKP